MLIQDSIEVYTKRFLNIKLHATIFLNVASFHCFENSEFKYDAKSDVPETNGLCH